MPSQLGQQGSWKGLNKFSQHCSIVSEYTMRNTMLISYTFFFLLQVTWSPPLIPNGEIHSYEIRLSEPRITFSTNNTSELNATVTDLVPYTNYSITVLACSKGGGHIGGCTESLPTQATTLPTRPEGLSPLSVVAVSESFLAISWEPPTRPNGPNIR